MITNTNEIKSRLTPEGVLALIGYPKSQPSRSGDQIRDYCPIHQGDKQKSLVTDSETGAFKCHSCGATGGDLIKLYMLSTGCSFPDAIQVLASHAGIVVVEDKNQVTPGAVNQSPTYKVSNLAAQKELEAKKIAKSRAIAHKVWTQAAEAAGHPYFEKKCMEPPPGVRYGKDERGNSAVIVPFYDLEERLQAIQYINSNGEKNKFFATDTAPSGAFFNFSSITGSPFIFLCEGIATAGSVWLSQGKAVTTLSCGTCWNIPKVAQKIQKKYPGIEIVVCIDDDKGGDDTAKTVLALGLTRISFRRPDFTGMNARRKEAGTGKWLDTDFNDVHRLAGIEVVREQLQREWGWSE